ncbi:hypothetical protein [Citricoccus nitrophenolicus]
MNGRPAVEPDITWARPGNPSLDIMGATASKTVPGTASESPWV